MDRNRQQYGRLTRILSTTRSGRQRLVALVLCALTIVLIGGGDVSSGKDLTFGILYLLPVSVGALVVVNGEAYVLAAFAAATWMVADRWVTDQSVFTSVWNAFGRLFTMSVVVYLITALRTLVRQRSAAEASSREFLSAAAHQLRTPIAGLISSADAFMTASDDATRERLLKHMSTATGRARRQLASLLEMSRLDHFDPPELRTIDVATVCRRIVRETSSVQGAIDIAYRGPDVMPVRSNAEALHEALGNLVDNALRHAVTSVVLEVRDEGRVATVSVSDDGPGLPAGGEITAFDRFVSMDGGGGTGLGLPIAAASARSVGAELRYQDRRFVITVPRE